MGGGRRSGAIAAVILATLAPAAADPAPRDAASWAKLIEAAKARGGTKTKLDQSSSYVFQQPDGDYLTLTEWRAPLKRFICVIAKDQKSTVCVRWETGATTYGERADDASPWKTRSATALEDTSETSPSAEFLGKIGDFVGGALGMNVRSAKHGLRP